MVISSTFFSLFLDYDKTGESSIGEYIDIFDELAEYVLHHTEIDTVGDHEQYHYHIFGKHHFPIIICLI